MELQSKVAIVTGASSGLGSAFAQALIAEGVALLYGIGRNQNSLESLQNQLGDRFIPVVLDITDLNRVKEWVGKVFGDKNLPDILINNAGTGSFARIDEMPSEDWYKVINTNVNGMYHITSELVKLMRKKTDSSHIVNIGSILGTTGKAEGTAYCASKFAVNGFSEALVKELRGDNIKVTCINPGSIETDFFKNSGIETHHNMLQPKDIANTLVHVLKTPDNMLIDELIIRPLNPKPPQERL